jgi:hypothetical protein
VPEGNAGNARLALVPGLRVPVRELVGTAAVAKGVVLEAEPLGRLPVIRFVPGGWGMFDPESEIDATYALGPFPFETVTATFAGADGAPRRVVVKSGPLSAAPR